MSNKEVNENPLEMKQQITAFLNVLTEPKLALA